MPWRKTAISLLLVMALAGLKYVKHGNLDEMLKENVTLYTIYNNTVIKSGNSAHS